MFAPCPLDWRCEPENSERMTRCWDSNLYLRRFRLFHQPRSTQIKPDHAGLRQSPPTNDGSRRSESHRSQSSYHPVIRGIPCPSETLNFKLGQLARSISSGVEHPKRVWNPSAL
jgi:hypothetical protein